MRTSPPLARRLVAAGLLLSALAGSGCVERVIREGGPCGDGRLDPGEICLGRGERSTLAIEGLTGLVMRTADFDGDEHVDLLVLGTDPSGVVESRLWRGRGDGRFDPAVDPGVRGCSAYAVAGQADPDAIDDLLMDDCGPTMSLFSGTESGVFSGPLTLPTGLDTRSSGLVDIDRDERREVVVMGTLDAQTVALTVLERVSDGSFTPAAPSVLGSTTQGLDPTGLGLLDVNDDDRYDALLVQAGRAGAMQVAHGEANLRFSPAVPIGPPALVADTTLVRDLDEDERPDVLAVSFDEEALVFLRAEAGDLVERTRTVVPGLRVGPAAGGDIDADDHFDLLLFEPGTRGLQAWFGRGDGGFDGPHDVRLDAPIGQIALVDLDEDGALDIVAGTFEAGTIQILLSDP